MFLGWIEIPKSVTRYLDMPEEKKRELTKKKKRRRRRKKPDSKAEDKETPLKCETLHSQAQKNKKDRVKIEFNGGKPLENWDYSANKYKTN
ncbi:hypothetical protein COD21_24515 [Bacillus cereus]|uniref:hypothetical protein n=1 Tax=Bacillus cereus TaxID=1396 RepID=UPI000BFB2B73|nr:hypothetical protein [Bacillus cereus]PGU06692.1 hypothetical protein COD21_24515 [Bacillus cereus]